MTLPPITPVQAIQMAVVAQSVGSVAASAFSKLLGSAAEVLGELGGDAQPPTTSPTKSAAGDGTGVLRTQLESLLSQLHTELKSVLSHSGLPLPSAAVIRQETDGGIATDGGIPKELLTGSDKLMDILRGIFARKQLLGSATGDGNGPATTAIQVTPGTARFVE